MALSVRSYFKALCFETLDSRLRGNDERGGNDGGGENAGGGENEGSGGNEELRDF